MKKMFGSKKNSPKTGSVKLRQRHPFFTLMLVPHEPGQRTTSWHISRNMVYFLMLFSALVAVLVAGSLWYSSHLTFKLAGYCRVFEENRLQRAELKELSEQNLEMNQKVQRLIKEEEEINRILGHKSSLKQPPVSRGFDLGRLLFRRAPTELGIVKKNHKELKKLLAKVEEKHAELLAEVKDYETRFAHTPSIWPVDGRISSSFGFRKKPLGGGGSAYHPAIDIAANYGTPIRAAADGAVIMASWYGGYGLAVKINHGNGLTTLYGHNSRLAVRAGSTVKKGQTIAYVGSTGYATGPHVHYEMASWGRPINPEPYLDLDIIFTIKKWQADG